MSLLPTPTPGADAAQSWVAQHLADVVGDRAGPSPRFRGGQSAADAALAAFDVSGYARSRNEVCPDSRRGASALSPYIRHGLLSLPRVWRHVADGPRADVEKFRDELLWQEYARHLYARLGRAFHSPLRAQPSRRPYPANPWQLEMECMRIHREELETDGWMVNQVRMWFASHWSVRCGADWRAGEREFFRHLLDGSRAANLLGWQWTVGAATGRPYGFSRWQVEKRAPGMCARCSLQLQCPIQRRPHDDAPVPIAPPPNLARDPDLGRTAGPREVVRHTKPDAVWLTAESLGDGDPALVAHPGLPVVFAFDRQLLSHWRLSAKRLIFLVETLAEIGTHRDLEVHLGDPRLVLAERRPAVVFTPVDGWRKIVEAIAPAEIHPWPWLAWPRAGSLSSYSAWRKQLALGTRRQRRRSR